MIAGFPLKLFVDPVGCLPSVLLVERNKLPGFRAVYLVVSEDKIVVYVGKTENLAQRWVKHSCYRQLKNTPGMRIAWLKLDDEEPLEALATLETHLICCYRPLLNKNVLPIEKKTRMSVHVVESMYRKLTIANLMTGKSQDKLINDGLEQMFDSLGINQFF